MIKSLEGKMSTTVSDFEIIDIEVMQSILVGRNGVN